MRKLRDTWRMARLIRAQAAAGRVVITVPHQHVARVNLYIWRLRVADAQERWAGKLGEVSLENWRNAGS